MTEPTLPVEDGVEITLTCSAGYNNTGGDKAICLFGQLVLLDPTTTPPQCSIRMFYHQLFAFCHLSLLNLNQAKNLARQINMI